MAGNFILTGIDYIRELQPDTEAKLVWGGAKNIGDDDYVWFRIYDKYTNELLLEAGSDVIIPAGKFFSFEIYGALKDVREDWLIKFTVGWKEGELYHFTDSIEFIIRRIRPPAGVPIEGATIDIDGYVNISDTYGNYLISFIPPGDYVISVSKDGYKSKSEPITIIEYTTLEKDFILEPEIPPPPSPASILFLIPLAIGLYLITKKK